MNHSRKSAPRVLLLSLMPFLGSARLAKRLQQVGFEVGVIARPDHPARVLRESPKIYGLGFLGPLSVFGFGAVRNTVKTIHDFKADLLIPCDDLSTRIAWELRRSQDPVINALLQRSFGSLTCIDILESKAKQVELARSLGLQVPETLVVKDEAELLSALSALGDGYLKLDGSWAGQGVLRVRDNESAMGAWDHLSTDHTVKRALGRIPTRGLRFAFAQVRSRPTITLQARVEGQAAVFTAACNQGRILAGIGVTALETMGATGPAAVVHAAHNEAMATAAASIAKALNLSGLAGFDFIVSADGTATFLELNPRATPVCSLPLKQGDLCAELFTMLGQERPLRDTAIMADIVALFPNEWKRNPRSDYLVAAYHDVPWDEPGLIAFAQADPGLSIRPQTSKARNQQRKLIKKAFALNGGTFN